MKRNDPKIYYVYDGNSLVGSYFAKNGKQAIARAQSDQVATASAFRKSQPAVVFRNPVAEETKRAR